MKRLVLGFLLVVSGVVLPLLLVLGVLEPSYALSFLSFVASLLGLGLGLTAGMRHRHAKPEESSVGSHEMPGAFGPTK